MNDLKALLSPVTTFIFDYDGVMTDGTVYMDSYGDPLRSSNVKDGYALQLATKLHDYMRRLQLRPEQIVFMGDDIPDLRVMQQVGVPACPADAAEEVKAISVFVRKCPGGRGCARDVIEQTMKIQGKWLSAEAYSW